MGSAGFASVSLAARAGNAVIVVAAKKIDAVSDTVFRAMNEYPLVIYG
jgi:hypothetical protein